MASRVEDDEQAARPAARQGYEIGRLLAFTDGVFAIAITLLVLSIPIPNVPPGPDENARLAAALARLAPNLTGFCLSFVLVGAQWIVHHRMLRRLDFCDGPLLWLNLAVLLGICLVPFGTGVLIRYGDSATGVIAYAALQAGIGIAFLALRSYLAVKGALPKRSVLTSLVAVVGFLASMPVALWEVRTAYALWFAGFALSRVFDARQRGSWR
jgi:uncharacterized membrane protein